MNFLIALVASSIVGSGIFIIMLLFRSITDKIFSKAWHYYSLLVPLTFLFGGMQIAISLMGLIPSPAAKNIISIPMPQGEAAISTPFEFIMPASYSYAEAVSITSIARQPAINLERLVPFMLTIWAIGVVLFVVTSTVKYFRYRHLTLHKSKLIDSMDCKDCKIPIVVSSAAHTPMLIGLIKPKIVLPDMNFSNEELSVVLAHEMVHHKRKDLLVKLLMLAANAVHWFNPVVYALNKQLGIACELSCDEKVVSKMDIKGKRLYGETILQVLSHSTTNRNLRYNIPLTTNLCSSSKNFKRRLINMMKAKKEKRPIAAFVAATAVLCVSFAMSGLVGSAMPIYAGEATSSSYQAAPMPSLERRSSVVIFAEYEELGLTIEGLYPGSDGGFIANPMQNVFYQGQLIRGFSDFGHGVDMSISSFDQGEDIWINIIRDERGNIVELESIQVNRTLFEHSRVVMGEDEVLQQRSYRDEGGNIVELESVQAERSLFEHRLVVTDEQEGLSRFYIVNHVERGITMAWERRCGGYYSLPEPNIAFEAAAKIAADEIYNQFGVCIEGMELVMFAGGGNWTGNIRSEELTTFSAYNDLFFFRIDGSTGEFIELIMNTPEAPWLG